MSPKIRTPGASIRGRPRPENRRASVFVDRSALERWLAAPAPAAGDGDEAPAVPAEEEEEEDGKPKARPGPGRPPDWRAPLGRGGARIAS